MKSPLKSSPTLAALAGLIGIAILQFLTMPKYVYIGDIMAIKAEAAHLINTGKIGFDYAEKGLLSASITEYRGQYFFENDQKQKRFSKYGFFYTLCSAPPLLLKRLLTGELEYADRSPLMMLIGNCYYILLTLIFTTYLYKTFGLYNQSRWQLTALVLASIYASYFWYYLRSPDKEIFQMISFTAAIYHTLRYLRLSPSAPSAWRDLAAALAWAGFTYLLKPLYALLVILITIFAAWKLYGSYRVDRRACLAPGSPWRQSALVLPAILLLLAAISFTHNYLRCGNILVAGYGQDTHDPVEFTFTAAHFLGGLATYFLRPGNGNWFLHHPLLVLALFGYAAFYRSHRTEALFLLAVVAVHTVVLAFHTEWIGEWCYGPRFCLHLVMCAAIPAALAIKNLAAGWQARRGRIMRGAAILALSLLALVSLRAQVYVNSWKYFTIYNYSPDFLRLGDEKVGRYFTEMPHLALFYRDLAAYRDRGRKFPPLSWVDSSDLPIEVKEKFYIITTTVIRTSEWNYLLLPRPE